MHFGDAAHRVREAGGGCDHERDVGEGEGVQHWVEGEGEGVDEKGWGWLKKTMGAHHEEER